MLVDKAPVVIENITDRPVRGTHAFVSDARASSAAGRRGFREIAAGSIMRLPAASRATNGGAPDGRLGLGPERGMGARCWSHLPYRSSRARQRYWTPESLPVEDAWRSSPHN